MNDKIQVDQGNGKWETIDAKPRLLQMKVPGGWLVTVIGGFSCPVSFYHGPEHQ